MRLYIVQELRCQTLACTSQLGSSCRWFSAGFVLPAKPPCETGLRKCFFANAYALIDNTKNCHTSSRICNSTGCKSYTRNGHQASVGTRAKEPRETRADRSHLSWPSIFHPLLAGLPSAPLRGGRQMQQRQQHEADSSSVLMGCWNDTRPALANLLASPIATPPGDGKKPRAGIFYLIHTFSLHPYEAIVFEEALYRFLGQRTLIGYEESCAIATPQPHGRHSLPLKHSEGVHGFVRLGDSLSTVQRQSIYVSAEDIRGDCRTNFVASQAHETLPQTRQSFALQTSARKDGAQLPTRHGQQDPVGKGQPRSEHAQPLPSVACAFLHHPPYSPAAGRTSCECSSSRGIQGGLITRQKVSLTNQAACPTPRPSRAVIFGLSGQPLACVRDPETVLKQHKALFIKRFTGGGTVVLGSGHECFCVGLLLPYTFSHSRPYPRDLLNLSTSLYLGEDIWGKQRCVSSHITAQRPGSAGSCFRVSAAETVPKQSAVSRDSGSSSIGATAAARSSTFMESSIFGEYTGACVGAACGNEPQVAGVHLKKAGWPQVLSNSLSLHDLSPFTSTRWGMLENDYVVKSPSAGLSCANTCADALPGVSEDLLPKGTGHSVERKSQGVKSKPEQTTREAGITDDPSQFPLKKASRTVYKVGGNAQALSRQYALQHTSFVWDEEQLQHELKDLLLLPKNQPKYRASRPHTAFLRSVREGLKLRVPLASMWDMDHKCVGGQETICTPYRGDSHPHLSPTETLATPCVAMTRAAAAEVPAKKRPPAKGLAISTLQSSVFPAGTALSCRPGRVELKQSLFSRDAELLCGRDLCDEVQQHSRGLGESALASLDSGSCVQPDSAVQTRTNLALDTPSSVLLSLGLLFEGHVWKRNAASHTCSCHQEEAAGRPAPHSRKRLQKETGDQRDAVSNERLHVSTDIDCVDVSFEEQGAEERKGDEDVWDCVHCVVAADNVIPVEFQRLWDAVDRVADIKSKALPGSETCSVKTTKFSGANAGVDEAENIAESRKTKAKEIGRPLYVLPVEAVRDLVHELFEGSLKHMRSTRLIGVNGETISESTYKNIFEVNRIIPV